MTLVHALTLAALLIPCADHQPGWMPDPNFQARVMRSTVLVHYDVHYDGGEAPTNRGWTSRCANCGNYHSNDAEEAIEEQRPMGTVGFMIAHDKVIVADPLIHPRFTGDIRISLANETVTAQLTHCVADQNAVILTLDEPLSDAAPLVFDTSASGPFWAIRAGWANGTWTTTATPLPWKLSVTQYGRQYSPVPSNCVIVDRHGTPVGMSMIDELPADGSWRGSPTHWVTHTTSDMATMLERVRSLTDQALLRVALTFRSPTSSAMDEMWMYGLDEEDMATERDVLGILTGSNRILVIASLAPQTTARLERVDVHLAPDTVATATFEASLRDWGAFVATFKEPVEPQLKWLADDIYSVRNRMLLSAEIKVKGEQRTAHFMRGRIPGFRRAFRGWTFPALPGDEEDLFMFTTAGRLVALPIARRALVADPEDWYYHDRELTPASYIRAALDDIDAHIDTNNIPRSEAEENRLGWMGVELQPLDPNLARAHGVSHLITDEMTGALVSHVYPDSPATRAGIEVGHVLLRLHVEGRPRPLNIRLMDYGNMSYVGFSWEEIDQVPLEYLGELPAPWPAAETVFTRALTDIGVGRDYTAEFFYDGAVHMKPMTVVQGPDHYGSAPRHKNEALGLTVRGLTYEVRQFLQKKPTDPGVVISKIENGSKAAVAGVKPYELITHVNEEPVRTVDDFATRTSAASSIRLTISRMNRERIVKMQLN